MIHGLIWLPLLGIFVWLAWAGWNEYQKVETYRTWAEQFDRAKYDIYAVLGQKGNDLTWGKPTRKGPIEVQTFSLQQVQDLQVVVGDRPIDLSNPPDNGRNVALEFRLANGSIRVPFTEVGLAVKWGQFLQRVNP